jgi:hypothetical protein
VTGTTFLPTTRVWGCLFRHDHVIVAAGSLTLSFVKVMPGHRFAGIIFNGSSMAFRVKSDDAEYTRSLPM